MQYGIYCLSYNNPKRRVQIQSKFESQGLAVQFYDGVSPTDPRIQGRPLAPNIQRAWSIMYGHLDMLRLFVNSGKEFGIFCEDDILIRKDFCGNLAQILSHFVELRLDVLLLGCLCSNPDFMKYSNFPERPITDGATHPFRYYAYDSNPSSAVWGTQMYLLHKSHAEFLLEKYAHGYADLTIQDKSLVHFSADWTITKEGEKAVIHPLVAIENAEAEYEDEYQGICRKKCYRLFYSSDLFV
jgi:GR25 family glycosyltransferase involved in LPS biosynthesis